VRAIVQRVTRAQVRANGRVTGEIGPGLLVLLGVTHGDSDAEARRLAEKTAALRCFNDDAGAMNRSVKDAGGAVLVVSQFTLYGDTRKGHRPSFVEAARPEHAEAMYRAYLDALRGLGLEVAEGLFRAHMDVELVNDGPVTLALEVAPSRARAGAPAPPASSAS
jgi:D-tyrosyl-tRNA(Tyr) deacylase